MHKKYWGFFLAIRLLNAQIHVTTASDAVNPPPAGSLRAALFAAGDNERIVIDSGVGDITLAAPLPTIAQTGLTISSVDQITLSGASSYQIFSVTALDFAVSNIHLADGLSKGGAGGSGLSPGGGGLGAGGAIYIQPGASVTLGKSTLSNHKAQGGAGGTITGVAGAGGGGGGAGSGGAGTNDGGSADTDGSSIYNGGGGGGGNCGGAGGFGTTPPGTGGILNGAFGGGGGGGQGTLSGPGSPSAGGDAYYSAILTYLGGTAASNCGGGGAGAGGNGNNAVSTGGSGGIGLLPNDYGGGGGGGGSGSAVGGAGYQLGGGGGSGSGAGGAGGSMGGGGGGTLSGTGGQGGFGGGGGYPSGFSVFGGGSAGSGGSGSGGGGAALGGAIFVYLGGTLTLNDGVVFPNNSTLQFGAPFATTRGPELFLRSGATLIVQNNLAPIAINSVIGSNGDTNVPQGGLIMQGTSTLILGAANQFTHSVTITSGTIQISQDLNLGNTANSVIIQDGTLHTTGSFPSARDFLLTGDAKLAVDNVQILTLSGTLSGGGSCTKTGPGTLIFENANSYTGGTLISAGLLQLGTGGSLDSAGSVNVQSGAAFDISPASGAQTIGSLLGAGSVTLGAIDLTFGSSANATFSGPMTGNSVLTKAGSGKAIFSGDNSGYSGSAVLQSGTWEIDGAFGGDIAVSGGATLQGIGTIAGTVDIQANGTIKPGNPLGTLTANALSIDDSSCNTYIRLQPEEPGVSTSSSSLAIGSSAIVDGALTVNAPIGVYPSAVTYTILTANTSLAGTFAPSVVFVPGGQNMGPYQVLYSLSAPFTVTLSFTAVSPPFITTSLPGNTNGQHLINYLNQFNTDPTLQFVVFDLSTLSPDALNAAVNSISPARNAISTFVGQNTIFSIANVVSMRLARQRLILRDMRTSFGPKQISSFADLAPQAVAAHTLSTAGNSSWLAPAASPGNYSWGSRNAAVTDDSEELLELIDKKKTFSPRGDIRTETKQHNQQAWWLQGFGSRMYQGAAEENPSYTAGTGGLVIGYEYYGQENGLLGAAVSYAQSHVSQADHAGSNNINYFTATIYGTVYRESHYLELGIAGSANPITNKRRITYPEFNGGTFQETAKSSYLAGQIVPHFGGGCDWDFSWGTLEPFFALDCAVFYQPAFSEKGAAPLNMQETSSWSELLRTEIGLHAYEIWRTSVGDFVLRETLSYVNQKPYGVGKIFANIVGYPPGFSLNSLTKVQNMVSPAIEFLYRMPRGIFFAFSYVGQYQFWGQTYRSNAFFGQLGFYF